MSVGPDEEEFPSEFEGDEWTRRIFEHYGCASAVGDYEILVYAMLLEHRPQLISPDERKRAGRRTLWTVEEDIRVYETVEKCRNDEFIPSRVRAFHTKIIEHIHRKPWFVQEIGRNLSAGTLGNAYARGKKAIDARKSENELS